MKKNIVCILLHETSSGFSPPSATKIRRMGRAALNGVDRTPYTTRHKKKSFVAYHTQRISKNIVHCDATAALEKVARAKAKLSNMKQVWYCSLTLNKCYTVHHVATMSVGSGHEPVMWRGL